MDVTAPNPDDVMDQGADQTPPPDQSANATAQPAAAAAAPDTGSLPAGRTGAAPAPPAPKPKNVSPFEAVLQALGGGPKVSYTTDATGTHKVITAPTNGEISRHIIAGALLGLARGSQQRGPGAGIRSFGAGAEAVIDKGEQQDKDAQTQSREDFNQQQSAQLRAAQIFDTNQRAILTSRQAEAADEDTRQKYIEHASPIIDQAKSAEFEGSSALLREHLTQQQIHQEHSQPGARMATTNIYLPDGETPLLDQNNQPVMVDGHPRMEYTYAELNPNAQVSVPADTVDQAVKNGFRVAGYTPGAGASTMPIQTAANMVHYNQGISNFQGLVGKVNDELGLKGKAALNSDEIIGRNPGLGSAFYKLASYWDGDPAKLDQALGAMTAPVAGKDGSKTPNPNASAGRQIVQAIGGDNLRNYLTQVSTKEPAAKAAAEENAKIPGKVAGAVAEQAAILPGQEAKENRLNAASEARTDRKQDAQDARKFGSAFDPQTNERVYMSMAEANSKGLADSFEAMPNAATEKGAIRQLNDVQRNLSYYSRAARQAVATPPTPTDYVNLHTILNKAGAFDFDAKVAAGGELKLPVISALTEGLSRETNSEAYAALSPQAKDLLDGYYKAMSSVPAYQKALTNVGRSNKETLDLEMLANVTNPTMKPADILRRAQAFQDNVDAAAEGRVRFRDLPLPKDVRKQYETAAPAAGAKPAAAQPSTWGQQFGGVARH